MSFELIQNPLDNDKSTKSLKNSKQNKSKKDNIENKENIPNNIKPHKLVEEEIQSPKIKEKSKNKNTIINKIINNITKTSHEKYEKKLREDTMRNELDKVYNETERLKQEYEEKNSKYYLFNDPQFKKYIKGVEIQLYLLLGLSILLNILSISMMSNLGKKIEGISITCIIISILLFSNTLLLIACVKIGLLNDKDLAKAFRFFVISELLSLINSVCFNFISVILYNKKISNKIWIYLLLILIVLVSILVIKKCLILFIESCLILLGMKTEYSVLISKEKKEYDKTTTSLSFSMNKTHSDLLEENDSQNKNEENDDKFKNFNYFNKFHYSVSSERKSDYNFNNFKKI
jgi:hypothetical protein